MEICDTQYRFTLADIGSYGSSNDCGILAKYLIVITFDSRKMNFPETKGFTVFPTEKLHYYLVGDETFPIKNWLMRPCP